MSSHGEARSFRIGEEYRDTTHLNDPSDQFIRWLNEGGRGGIGNTGGVRALRFDSLNVGVTSCLVLVTRDSAGQFANPWEDHIDVPNGRITYWGDAKAHRSKRVEEWVGNQRLLAAYEVILDNERALIPPILHFSKPATGFVRFNGLCVLDRLELTWFEDEGTPVRNFRAHLSILDQQDVDLDWILARRRATSPTALLNFGPEVWRNYLRAGVISRLKVWAPQVRDRLAQLPAADSADSRVLDQVISLTPVQFEAAVVKVFEDMDEVTHRISRTRHVGDGGFDFFGTFTMPQPLGYEVDFLGEAKRYRTSNPVTPKDVSRLVARLGRGDYGLFVTTSYFTSQAQQEVLEDGYPVRLFSGADLVGIMRQLRIAQGDVISPLWLRTVEAEALRRLA